MLVALFILPIPDRLYTQKAEEILKKAQIHIYMVMFEMRYYPRFPQTGTNKLIRILCQKAKKGVDVQVILDRSAWARENTRKNLEVAEILARNNVKVFLDKPRITTHCKLIIVDKKYCIVGSTNWSYSAFEKNHEASVLISDPSIADYFIKYFEKIKKECILYRPRIRYFLPSR